MSSDPERSLRDILREDFHKMGGFAVICERVPDPDTRMRMMTELATGFTGIAIWGTEDRLMKSFLSFCRLMLDTFKDPSGLEQFYLDTTQRYVEGGPEVAHSVTELQKTAPPAADTADAGSGATSPEPCEIDVDHERSNRAEPFPTRNIDNKDVEIFTPPDGAPPDLPVDYPRLLLPCPAAENSMARSRWLSGEIADPRSIAVGFACVTPRAEERMLEAEAEMSGDPMGFLLKHGIISLQRDDLLPNPDKIVSDLGGIGAPAGEVETLTELRLALSSAIELLHPEHRDAMAHARAVLRVGPEALIAAARVIAAERIFLADFEPSVEAERPGQNILGSAHPEAALTPGMTLKRCMFMHLATGRKFIDALVDSLAETRLAQVSRLCTEDDDLALISGFDGIFFADCLAPADAYTVAKMDDLMPAC